MLWVLVFLSNAFSQPLPVCTSNPNCPVSTENFELSYDPLAVTNPILADLKRCGNKTADGAIEDLKKKGGCIASLFDCTASAVSGAAKAVGKAGVATYDCATSPVACYSTMSDGLSNFAKTLGEIREIRDSIPLEKRQAMVCGMAGTMGPNVVLAMALGYGILKLGPQFIVLLQRIAALKNLIKSEAVSAETVEALMKLDDANGEKVQRLHLRGHNESIEKVMTSCRIK